MEWMFLLILVLVHKSYKQMIQVISVESTSTL